MMVLEEKQIPYCETDRFCLYEGDCRSVLPIFPDCYFDSIVTDPPAGISFMGKDWDHHKGGRDQWVAWMTDVMHECLRVLKPGGHALVWAIPRTSHWTGWAIESAGFEVRDRVSHLFGSGFPKSLDISKQIDARGGATVSWFGPWLRAERERRGITQKSLAEYFPSRSGGLTGCIANWELGLNMPTPEQFNLLCEVMDLPFSQIQEAEREVIGRDRNWGNAGAVPLTGYREFDLTKPTSDAAKQWNGWGTALKPACEDWWLCRKPLEGTVAENVLRHGTGGLNIAACRIESGNDHAEKCASVVGLKSNESGNCFGSFKSERNDSFSPLGRWPANVIHDGSNEVLAGFPDSDGQQGRLNGTEPSGAFSTISTGLLTRNPFEPRGDSGSAARFFYCAKADNFDRNEGLEDLPLQSAGAVTDRKDGSAGLNSPRAGAGRTNGSRNSHPTVKPTELMRYLCRLITPPSGLVLDPFCGSGSTGKAAMLEGLRFVGIELNADYCELAQRRIEAATKQGLLFA